MVNTLIRFTWKEILALGVAIGSAGATLMLAYKISKEDAPKCFNTLVSNKPSIEDNDEKTNDEDIVAAKEVNCKKL